MTLREIGFPGASRRPRSAGACGRRAGRTRRPPWAQRESQGPLGSETSKLHSRAAFWRALGAWTNASGIPPPLPGDSVKGSKDGAESPVQTPGLVLRAALSLSLSLGSFAVSVKQTRRRRADVFLISGWGEGPLRGASAVPQRQECDRHFARCREQKTPAEPNTTAKTNNHVRKAPNEVLERGDALVAAAIDHCDFCLKKASVILI